MPDLTTLYWPTLDEAGTETASAHYGLTPELLLEINDAFRPDNRIYNLGLRTLRLSGPKRRRHFVQLAQRFTDEMGGCDHSVWSLAELIRRHGQADGAAAWQSLILLASDRAFRDFSTEAFIANITIGHRRTSPRSSVTRGARRRGAGRPRAAAGRSSARSGDSGDPDPARPALGRSRRGVAA